MPDEDESLFCPLEFRYGRDSVRELFSRGTRLNRALRVEAALALSEAELGMVPADAAAAIDKAATLSQVSLERVDALERSLRHDVMAMTRALAEAAGPPAGGSTSVPPARTSPTPRWPSSSRRARRSSAATSRNSPRRWSSSPARIGPRLRWAERTASTECRSASGTR